MHAQYLFTWPCSQITFSLAHCTQWRTRVYVYNIAVHWVMESCRSESLICLCTLIAHIVYNAWVLFEILQRSILVRYLMIWWIQDDPTQYYTYTGYRSIVLLYTIGRNCSLIGLDQLTQDRCTQNTCNFSAGYIRDQSPYSVTDGMH